jgi:hypothetical protein
MLTHTHIYLQLWIKKGSSSPPPSSLLTTFGLLEVILLLLLPFPSLTYQREKTSNLLPQHMAHTQCVEHFLRRHASYVLSVVKASLYFVSPRKPCTSFLCWSVQPLLLEGVCLAALSLGIVDPQSDCPCMHSIFRMDVYKVSMHVLCVDIYVYINKYIHTYIHHTCTHLYIHTRTRA